MKHFLFVNWHVSSMLIAGWNFCCIYNVWVEKHAVESNYNTPFNEWASENMNGPDVGGYWRLFEEVITLLCLPHAVVATSIGPAVIRSVVEDMLKNRLRGEKNQHNDVERCKYKVTA